MLQIRAMLKASVGLNNLKIMLPMVTTLSEIKAAKKLINSSYNELLDAGVAVKLPQIGVMIEVPSLVYQIEKVLQLVDFVSVGSNDLTQYLLAVDRNNPQVSCLYDSFNPAVLMALQKVCLAAKAANKPVGLCGELAASPLATVLLVGMGFDSLSMNSMSLLKVKWVLRGFSLHHCKAVLDLALKLDSGKEVRELLRENLTDAGFGGLIRAGKY